MILIFGTKLDSDELYCVTKTATYCLSVPLFVHFSFSPMKLSVTDFSAPIGASVFKFCVHLQVGKVYSVNENKDANPYFAFFLIFSFGRSYIIHMDISSVKDFSATTRLMILKFGTKLDSDELYCVTKNSHKLLISPFICSFFFLSNGNFRHRFLSSYWSQCFQILCSPSGRQSVLCK